MRGDGAYLEHFTGGAGHTRVGEKSAFYLYSRTAPRRIHGLNPDARLICVLRDPIDMLWSLYRYNVSNLTEDLPSFDLALQAEADRKAGRRLPVRADIADNLYYRELADFSSQLERYYRFFPREQVKVVLFEDLKNNPDQVYAELLEFLGLRAMPPETRAALARELRPGVDDLATLLDRNLAHWLVTR